MQSVYLDDGSTRLTSLMVGQIPGIRSALQKRPLVFLNACEVGRPALSLSGIGGFANAFINMGASAVIAPLWSVNDTMAFEVATRFYSAIRRGDGQHAPLAQILSDIRAAAYDADTGDDTFAAVLLLWRPPGTDMLTLNRSRSRTFHRDAAAILGETSADGAMTLFDPSHVNDRLPGVTYIHERVHQALLRLTTFGHFTNLLQQLSTLGLHEAERDICFDDQEPVQELAAYYVSLTYLARLHPEHLEDNIDDYSGRTRRERAGMIDASAAGAWPAGRAFVRPRCCGGGNRPQRAEQRLLVGVQAARCIDKGSFG